MRVACIVVGHNHWRGDTDKDRTFTRDFIQGLTEKNPSLKVLLIDNCSKPPYPADYCEVLRSQKRVGYAVALNLGLHHLEQDDYDWYITFNNDCEMARDGNVLQVIEQLDENILYGSGINRDFALRIDWQWSAWMCISRKVFRTVGYFDEQLAAAFEDFDYQLRARQAGFTLDAAKLPVIHLDEHTRYEDKSYPARWEDARLYFNQKHNLNMAGWWSDNEIERARKYL